jgi:hypothetical protein
MSAVFQLSYPEGLGRIFFLYVGMYLNTRRYTADGKAAQNVFSTSVSVSCEQTEELTVSFMCVHLEPFVQIMHRNSLITKRTSGKLSGNLQGEKAASGFTLSSLLLCLTHEKVSSDGSGSRRRKRVLQI